MNINHVADKDLGTIPTTTSGMVEGIFIRQQELHEKYQGVEHGNGLGLALIKDKKFMIDDPSCQYVIKDFAWRVTEELTEALEAFYDDNALHCMEEIIDALHFYTELLIICGITPDQIDGPLEDANLTQGILSPIYPIGLACNLLKNKPWKNSHLVTDINRLHRFLITGYRMTLKLAVMYGLGNMTGVYKVYMKKSMVNDFRIESNY